MWQPHRVQDGGRRAVPQERSAPVRYRRCAERGRRRRRNEGRSFRQSTDSHAGSVCRRSSQAGSPVIPASAVTASSARQTEVAQQSR